LPGSSVREEGSNALRVDDAERCFALAELALGAGDEGLELAFLLAHAGLAGFQLQLPLVEPVGLELDVDLDLGAVVRDLGFLVVGGLALVDLLGAALQIGLAPSGAPRAIDALTLALELLLPRAKSSSRSLTRSQLSSSSASVSSARPRTAAASCSSSINAVELGLERAKLAAAEDVLHVRSQPPCRLRSSAPRLSSLRACSDRAALPA
jgi:hypothetical protein